jgi:hypothetical protein
MFAKIIKMIIYVLIFIVVLVLISFVYFYFSVKKENNPQWGVNFSQKHAYYLGLDWRVVYTALLDDLKVKKIKVAAYWDLIESNEGVYDFSDLDWQIKEAEKRDAKIILAFGLKAPRWPECHDPGWLNGKEASVKNEKLLQYLGKIVQRYNASPSISGWQVENEPFFKFGECSKINEDFLKKEIELVKSIDQNKRPIIISDTGEWSFWIKAAGSGDVVGITMYKKIWLNEWNRYFDYHIPAAFYQARAGIIKTFFNKEVICGELQAEPWGKVLLYDSPLEEQVKTMNLEQFKENVKFARKTGLKEFYLWGAEWWYWMKDKNQNPEIWNEAKNLFVN